MFIAEYTDARNLSNFSCWQTKQVSFEGTKSIGRDYCSRISRFSRWSSHNHRIANQVLPFYVVLLKKASLRKILINLVIETLSFPVE
jgi:hypothetical protein